MRPGGVIFLLENSTEYLFLLDQAFRAADLHNSLRVARYGSEAILYLKGIGIYGNRKQYPLPDVILIDLAVPDGSGLAVLGWVRRQARFDSIPIIVLVDPAQTRYLQGTLEKNATAHYANRNDLEGLARLVKNIGRETAPPEAMARLESAEEGTFLR